MAHFLISIHTTADEYLEPVELALALAAFEHEVTLVFAQQGLTWLMAQQSGRADGAKSPSKVLASLPLFNIKHCHAFAQQVEHAGVTSISAAQYQQLLQQADYHFSF